MHFLAPVIIRQTALADLIESGGRWTSYHITVTEDRDRSNNLPYARCTIGVDVRCIDGNQAIQNFRAWQRAIDLWPGDGEAKAKYDGSWNTATAVADSLRAELARREIAISAGIIEIHGVTPIRGEEWKGGC